MPDLAPRARSLPPLPTAVSLTVAGLVLLVFGATTPQLVTPAKTAVALLGLGLLLAGASRLGKRWAGPGFDVVFWFGAGWLLLLGLAIVFVPWLPLAEDRDVATTVTEPVFAGPTFTGAHPLGTNGFGLDLLARSLYGARSSLLISLSAVAVGTLAGGAIGMVAGYVRKTVDRAVGIATNSLLAVPPLILLIALATVLQPHPRNVALSLSLLTIPGMVRLARATTMAYANREFVVAARAMGARRSRVLVRELLPNVLLPVLSLAVVMISVLIVAEASLSFLGLGIQPPEPTWGNMIAEGEGQVFEEHPHIVLVPGAFLFLTVFAFNIVGEKARGRWDSRSVKL
ncbi:MULTISPECIES: ABC transporter permease [unclassified Streptomyces]|uniref:ABC transporter permease n=1 Tax=unclassified Streptomyces TaxID=2593676 RepID=UPI00081B8205|nr:MULTISPECIES: ABC transporter permease [unclassified Streptomyces]MYQ54037.1 ABC transporter permease subunit [Streptomyces sp. SID4941]SCE17076.1 peptide/nickel transport system permease protein [Streptomyces sp. PalvLS-984]SDD12414.1 peptide/nickel transport system permease protein [Streptomyces sp. AmelKG-A3]